MKTLVPDTIAPPFARYAHGVEVPAGCRLVFTSGQLGLARDGTVPDAVRAQADICLSNIDAILAEAGAGRDDVVRVYGGLYGGAGCVACRCRAFARIDVGDRERVHTGRIQGGDRSYRGGLALAGFYGAIAGN
jgi:hypothetical protein